MHRPLGFLLVLPQWLHRIRNTIKYFSSQRRRSSVLMLLILCFVGKKQRKFNFSYFFIPQRRSLSCHREAKSKGSSSTSNSTSSSSNSSKGFDVVDNSECTAHGLEMPDTFQSCGNEACPQWTKGEWSLCHQSRCHGRNTAVQRREVACRYENGTAGSACDDYEKPPMRQDCYNERCKGVWRVEPWSEVGVPRGSCSVLRAEY